VFANVLVFGAAAALVTALRGPLAPLALDVGPVRWSSRAARSACS
jgi:hypothetical protein